MSRSTCIQRRAGFALLPVMLGAAAAAAAPLFDGRTFTGWEGDTKATWRIEDGVIIAGSLDSRQAKNDFLCTTRRFGDFELTLKMKLTGTEGFVNSGIQFRSERVPNHHEVRGYQADFGAGHDGGLYDESRRNRFLAKPSPEVLKQASRPGEWNEYRIRAQGPRIRLWLNGVETVDYTETDPAIARTGVIALQIHGNAVAEVRFKDIEIEELGPAPP